MKKLLLIILAMLALIALSPLLLGAPPGGHRSSGGHRTGSSSSHGIGSHSTSSKKSFSGHTTTFSTPGKPTFASRTTTSSSSTTFSASKTIVKYPATVKLPGTAATVGKIGSRQYAASYGVKFSRGVYFAGRSHRHWSMRSWSPRWRCWCWFCPSTAVWYYWNGGVARYYPVTYIVNAPPIGESPDAAEMPPGGNEVPQASPGEEPQVP